MTVRGSVSEGVLASCTEPACTVAVISLVRRNASYWAGKFWPHTAGSAMVSSRSTTLVYESLASPWRSMMLASNAVIPAVATAVRAIAATTMPILRVRWLRGAFAGASSPSGCVWVASGSAMSTHLFL